MKVTLHWTRTLVTNNNLHIVDTFKFLDDAFTEFLYDFNLQIHSNRVKYAQWASTY